MNNKFLNKVLGQIMSETIIDFTAGRIYAPAFSPFFSLSSFPYLSSSLLTPLLSSLFPPSFSQHCENVYGLNNEEIDYVWNEYRNIIHDKINE